MRRDYKQYYEENKLKNFYIRYDGKHYNDDLIEDLIQDQPGSVALNSFITVRDNLEKLKDSTIQSFCLECQTYEYWARVILAILEEIEGYEKLHMLLSNEKGPFDTPEDVKAQEEYTSKYSEGFKNSCTLKEYEWMYINQKICTLPIDTAKIIEEVFCYYDRVVKPRLTQKEADNPDKDTEQKNGHKQHPDSLFDVVSRLPKYDKFKLAEQCQQANKAIHTWLEEEKTKWDNDLLGIGTNEKMGQYLFRKTAKMLMDFRSCVPNSEEEWDEMRDGDKCFFCQAMELYYYYIRQMILFHNIKEDDSIKKIYNLCWFCSDVDDMFNSLHDIESVDDDEEEFDDSKTVNGVKQDNQSSLPDEFQSDTIKKYFHRALQNNYIDSQYKWLKPHAQLGYFCMKAFEQPRPITVLEQFFNVRNLAAAITQACYTAKRNDAKKWRKEMDSLIFND